MRRLAVGLLFLLCACGSTGPPGSAVSPQPSASPSSSLSQAGIKYRLIDSLGAPAYCDPLLYPVARTQDPSAAAQALFMLRTQSPTEFDAIVRHEHLDPVSLSEADTERILRQSRELAALALAPEGTRYRFDYQVVGPPEDRVTGSIDQLGVIRVERRTPAPRHTCPICLAEWTRIATPSGEVLVTEMRAGTVVWTLDGAGRRVAAPVLAVAHTPAPVGHEVVDLRLADGRVVDVSPGHRLADGRTVSDIRPGDPLDGSEVVGVDRRPYTARATWDLLPAGPTHVYWANGVLLGSTVA